MKVVVHNTDGVNAYAAEVSGLLQSAGARVTCVDARNGQHRPPPGVRWRRVLPANFGSASTLRQLLTLVRGLATTVALGLLRRHVVLVAYSRFPLEDLLFAGLAAAGRPVVVVVHNPVPREAESRPARFARRALLARATVVVVHAERLRPQVDPVVERGRIAVCPHPPYRHTAAPVDRGAVRLGADRRWVAFVGTLRWDKGIDLVPDLLARVPAPVRADLGLVVCGRGELPPGGADRIRALGVRFVDLTSPDPVPQELLLEVLTQKPLVLAPYVAATQSGTVIQALSMGCAVVAFDQGGIPDVLTAEGLVPTGDLDAMAELVVRGRGGSGVLAVPEWAEQAAATWWRVVQQARGPAGSRHPVG